MSLGGDPRRPRRLPGPGDALALVGVFSITVGSGVVAGVLLDEHFGTLPLLTIVGLAVGLVGGTFAVYRGLAPFRGR
ncbi:MAG: AtpZ/AtpI family protein [Candidatus Dormiibacterota bacterium]